MAKVFRAKDFKKENKGEPIKDATIANEASLPPFTFSFTAQDSVAFKGFELVRSREGIMFRNHTGYHVFVTPYTVDIEGNAKNTSLYEWLANLMTMKTTFSGHETEKFEPGSPLTKGEALEFSEIVTVANLTRPMTVFIDLDAASVEAKNYIDWLDKKQRELFNALSELQDEDLKANAVAETKEQMYRTALDSL